SGRRRDRRPSGSASSSSPEILSTRYPRIGNLAADMSASRWLPFAQADDGAPRERNESVDRC
ncbi:TPA: hypothetical protein ACNEXV_004841, partial [Escherichia coli]